jgi:hypothetical protein
MPRVASTKSAIEAKPLLRGSDINGRYLADERYGLLSPTPYTQSPLGWMLAPSRVPSLLGRAAQIAAAAEASGVSLQPFDPELIDRGGPSCARSGVIK